MQKVTYYHAGCPVCVEAEKNVVNALDTKRFEIEVVDLGVESSRIVEAEGFGVKSVPTLVLDGLAFHINFGASIDDLK